MSSVRVQFILLILKILFFNFTSILVAVNQSRKKKVSNQRTYCITANYSLVSLPCDCLIHLWRGDRAEGLVVDEEDTCWRQEAAVPAVHPDSAGLWLLSHNRLVSSLTMVAKPGLHHKANGRSGIDAAEESKLLAAAEEDPIRSAEANTAYSGCELVLQTPQHPLAECRSC